MVLAESVKMENRQQSVVGHLRTVQSNITGSQVHIAVDVEHGFMLFCHNLATSYLSLAVAHQVCISVGLEHSMEFFLDIILEFKVDLFFCFIESSM